jgi:hypothetical protein
LSNIETFSFEVMAPNSHQAGRRRVRASAAVGGTPEPDAVEGFDREQATTLKDVFLSDPMKVHHRAFALVCGTARSYYRPNWLSRYGYLL